MDNFIVISGKKYQFDKSKDNIKICNGDRIVYVNDEVAQEIKD